MKVVCINNGEMDIGKKGSYYHKRFAMIDTVRHEKLEKLGI